MTNTCPLEKTVQIRFEGRLDTARCGEIEDDVRTKITEAEGLVVFDMENVDFICSSFLRLCVFAIKQVGGERFQLVRVDPMVKRVFKIAGLDGAIKAD